MRAANALALGLFFAVSGTAQTANAQVHFADFTAPQLRPKQKLIFQDAKEQADLKHGTLVSLTLNNGAKVMGHIVRFDPKANRLYVRSQRGHAPVGYAENDIQSLKKAVRPLGKKQGQVRPRNIVEPEIATQVIINGTQRTVTYFTSVLSPAERDVLERLRRAENDLAALTYREDQREAALAQEVSLQDERVRSLRLINDTLRDENYTNYPYPPATVETEGILRRGQRKGVITILPQPIPATVGLIDRLPPVNPQAIAKARDELTKLQAHAVYEDSRLVAVVP